MNSGEVDAGIKLVLGYSCTLRHNEMDIMRHPRELAEDRVNRWLTHLAEAVRNNQENA